MCKKKVAMHSPGKRRYRVDMLVDTWNGSLRHVCSRECSLSLPDTPYSQRSTRHLKRLTAWGPSHKMVQGRRFGKLLHDNIPAMLHILER